MGALTLSEEWKGTVLAGGREYGERGRRRIRGNNGWNEKWIKNLN